MGDDIEITYVEKEPAKVSREEVEENICEILRKHGPDRHVDGYEKIADYVFEVLSEHGFGEQ